MTAEPSPPRGLGRRRVLARAVLLFERLWPALWPPLGVAGAFVCAALLDLPAWLPPLAQVLLLAATGLLMAGLLGHGLWRVRRPSAAEADRRLERESGLRHRPLAVLRDRPALPGAEALWAAHVARTQAQLGRLRVGLPRPGLAAQDRTRRHRCPYPPGPANLPAAFSGITVGSYWPAVRIECGHPPAAPAGFSPARPRLPVEHCPD